MRKAILFLNGQPPSDFPELSHYDKIYCTDGAYTYLIEKNILPDYVVGDFDSVNHKLFHSDVEVIHRPNQDFTDFDKTLQIIEAHGYDKLDIYGSTGQEHDHFLGNLSTALAYKERIQLTFHDDYATFYFIPKQYIIEKVLHRTISLIPFPMCKKLYSKGLRYPLEGMDMEFGKKIGTRNHAIEDTVEISYEEGELLVFISNYTSAP